MRVSRLTAGLALSLLVAAGLVAAPARAEVASTGDDDPSALVGLQRASAATTSLAYTATRIVTTWTGDGPLSLVLAVTQDGRGHRQVTASDTSGVPLGTPEYLSDGADDVDVPAEALRMLAAVYRLQAVDGAARVAGRPATVVLASRAGHVSARFWVDDATGLPLRQEVYDDAGLLRRLSTFVDLDVPDGADGDENAVRGPLVGLTNPANAVPAVAGAAWPDVVPLDGLASWRAQGWPCPHDLPGGLRLLGARQSDTSAGPVLQLTYTDGIDDASLFVQQGRLDADGLSGYGVQDWGGTEVHVADGTSRRLVWQGEDEVFTLVTDASVATTEQIVASLPAPRDGGPMESAMSAGRAVGAFAASATATVVGWIPGR